MQADCIIYVAICNDMYLPYFNVGLRPCLFVYYHSKMKLAKQTMERSNLLTTLFLIRTVIYCNLIFIEILAIRPSVNTIQLDCQANIELSWILEVLNVCRNNELTKKKLSSCFNAYFVTKIS